MTSIYATYGGYGNVVSAEYVAQVLAAFGQDGGRPTEVRLNPQKGGADLESFPVPAILDKGVPPFQVWVGYEEMHQRHNGDAGPRSLPSRGAPDKLGEPPSDVGAVPPLPSQEPVAKSSVTPTTAQVPEAAVAQPVRCPRGRPRLVVPEQLEFEGLSLRQVAERTGVSKDTVRRRLRNEQDKP